MEPSNINQKEGISRYKNSLFAKNPNTKRIKISTAGSGYPFIKQLKNFNSIWEDCQFFINEPVDYCDLWFVYGGLSKTEEASCRIDGTVFITNEPPSVKKYKKSFTDQFHSIITCHQYINHKNKIMSQQSLPWWIGHKIYSDGREDTGYNKNYDELKSTNNITKNKTISIIVSNKNFTKGHKNRLEFLDKIQKEFTDEIDIFGIGFNQVEDKWDAIAPYKYHIVIENAYVDDFWTEKLADAFLAESYPIYYGCPNIYKYFDKNSLSIIDIEKPEESIEKIRSIINSNLYDENIDKIRKSKNDILDKYQLFPMLCEYIHKYKSSGRITNITLRMEGPSNIRKIKDFIKSTILWKIITSTQK